MTAEVYESQGFILGPRVDAFEKAIAAYVGARHAIGMSSGTDAQLAVMMALGIGPGDDVVTSPYTFFASAGAVARLGARPVFVDIEPETFNRDPGRLERALTAKTKLIQPVHLYGQCADMDPIREIAKRKGIPVLEDACQSLGAAYRASRPARSESPAPSPSSVQEPRRIRRRRHGHDVGRCVRGDAQGDAHARRDEPLPSQVRGRKLPARRAQAAVLHVKLRTSTAGPRPGARTRKIGHRYTEAGGLPFEKGGLKFPREAAASTTSSTSSSSGWAPGEGIP